MSIFGIIGICFWIALIVFGIVELVGECNFFETWQTIVFVVILPLVVWIGGVFVGIGIATENEKVFVKKYLVQKETIEKSLQVEELSGFERVELVKQATELNGELAERKAKSELWHYVYYDNTIFDGVKLINLNKGE